MPPRVHPYTTQLTGGRKEQQDTCLVLDGGEKLTFLAVVADGAGGHLGGREAAHAVSETSRVMFAQHGGVLPHPEADLEALCVASHEAINKLGENPKNAPRSTVVALYIVAGKAWWVHVGDSRLYRMQGRRIVERSRDHTMAQILLEQGEIDDSEVGSHPDRIKLLKALGGESPAKPSAGSAEVAEGDCFLLCSDGFWENLKLREVERCLAAGPTQASLDRLAAKAVSRNGESGDNVTACAIQIGDRPCVRRTGWLFAGISALAGAVPANRRFGSQSKEPL